MKSTEASMIEIAYSRNDEKLIAQQEWKERYLLLRNDPLVNPRALLIEGCELFGWDPDLVLVPK